MKWSWPFASKHRMLISLVEQAGLCDIDIAVQEAYIIRARQCTFDVLAKRAIGDGAIYGCTQDMPEETAKTIVFFMDCFSPPVSDAIIKYFIGKGVARYAISAAKSIGRKLSEEEIGAQLEQIRNERFSGEDAFLGALGSYGLTERVLRRQLLFQLATLRFIEIRFRPSVAVGDGEIEIYYREQFVPQWEKNQNAPPPSLEEARDQVEAILIQERTDHALNLWLRDARRQARVEFHEEAFQ